VITNEKEFQQTAKAFYDNSECNSIEAFDDDIKKIDLLKTHFFRYDFKGTTNFQLLFNHFISFVNCFGIMSRELMMYKTPKEHHLKVNALFILIGQLKFDGTTEIDEDFFIALRKTVMR